MQRRRLIARPSSARGGGNEARAAAPWPPPRRLRRPPPSRRAPPRRPGSPGSFLQPLEQLAVVLLLRLVEQRQLNLRLHLVDGGVERRPAAPAGDARGTRPAVSTSRGSTMPICVQLFLRLDQLGAVLRAELFVGEEAHVAFDWLVRGSSLRSRASFAKPGVVEQRCSLSASASVAVGLRLVLFLEEDVGEADHRRLHEVALVLVVVRLHLLVGDAGRPSGPSPAGAAAAPSPSSRSRPPRGRWRGRGAPPLARAARSGRGRRRTPSSARASGSGARREGAHLGEARLELDVGDGITAPGRDGLAAFGLLVAESPSLRLVSRRRRRRRS